MQTRSSLSQFLPARSSTPTAAMTPVKPTANINSREKGISLALGTGLVWQGLKRAELPGILAFLAGGALLYRGWTGYCATYDMLGIEACTPASQRAGVRAKQGRKVVHSVHILRDREELYRYWCDFKNLPQMMRHLKTVEPLDERHSKWIARAPGGFSLEWEAELINDRPGEFLAWQSLPGSQVDTAGSVSFNIPSSGIGTEVVVSLKYDPPGGKWAAGLAHLFGQGLEGQLQEDLRNFKQLMEAGEIPTNAMRPTDQPEWVG